MTRGQHTELRLYLELLERDLGVGFALELLSDEQLAILDQLARYAVDVDDSLPESEKLSALPLLGAVHRQQQLRRRYAWLKAHDRGPETALLLTGDPRGDG